MINIINKITEKINCDEKQFYLIEEKKPNGYKNINSSSLQIWN